MFTKWTLQVIKKELTELSKVINKHLKKQELTNKS